MIKQVGNTFSLEGEKIGVGQESAKQYLKDNPLAIEKIKTAVFQQI